MTTGYRLSLARTVLFALLYAAAVYAGRRTAMVADGVSLVWPAAGVAAVWCCAQRGAPTRRLDLLLLAGILGTGNWLTGASPAVGVVAGLVGLIEVGVFLRALRRWRPGLWGAGGSETLRSPRDLWALLGAALAASCAAGVSGLLGRWLVTGSMPIASSIMSMARHLTGILIIGAAGIWVGAALRARRKIRRPSFWRSVEVAGLLAVSVAGQISAFAYDHRLPLSFALLGFTVLVGTRLRTPWVLVHNSVISAIAVQYTLLGSGPFAQVGDIDQRTVLVQLFCVLVALVGLALSLGRDERHTLLTALAEEKSELHARQAELAAQQEQASHHADLLTAIIDSMADGLAVIGPDSRVTLRNPAVTELLGEDEPAHLRALAGEDVRGVDMPVRSPGVPEGRVVRVTATSLPHPDGTRSAVVLFHDVTAERRHRDELTNFAGVVAHDLLNPLASVDGWTAAALEALDGVPEHPGLHQAQDDLARLTRASARMRGLIDGLLSYATAREATVAPVVVELAEVVADIVVARADAAVAAGKPEPRFSIGPLPAVRADPVLVRQLVDNLVGNAIKYTGPGVVPALEISAVSSPADPLVTVRIADNGIGIPDGQHEAIFGNFHRAHLTGDYLGTGLGLAICKRIVERHGGVISAADHPGGGSCFEFTLPAVTGSPTSAHTRMLTALP
ncbi:ATP-binding protein [Actinoplanes palleronii]|uniref:ATP-binding protein n=1 Tax=Actinoplanes palleronii TaxID=113570 RepID=UPI001EF2DE54|nr:ATP-binding protein [Actinoplanes palleronii]